MTYLLTACTQLPLSKQTKHLTLTSDHWQVNGKLSIKGINSANNKTTKRQTLRFKWQQNGSDYKITLSGGLGLGTTFIEKKSNYITMLRGKTVIANAPTAEILFEKITGAQLPISLLQYWILGYPSTTTDAVFNQPNNPQFHPLQGFKQQGWQVSYLEIHQVDQYLLPKRMTANNQQISLTAIFKHWQIGDAQRLNTPSHKNR